MFTRAIVRTPCKNMINGLTTAKLGKPDYEKAMAQHSQYIVALQECGLQVTVLPGDEKFPDSTFVEDTAILTPRCAIVTNPGAPSRRGETAQIAEILREFYSGIENISDPGTLDAGDVMMVGSHFYIGISHRTTEQGAAQLIKILNKFGLSGSTVHFGKGLHLKSGVAYLENNNLVLDADFVDLPEFRSFNRLQIDDDESYAANCIWVNGKVLVPKGFPKSQQMIEKAGYLTIELDVSEFRKLDGGLSCLSLRF